MSPPKWHLGRFGAGFRNLSLAVMLALLLLSGGCDNSDSKILHYYGGSTQTTQTANDSTSPNTVSDLAAVPGGKQILVSWTDPATSDFSATEIRRSSSGPTSDHQDGDFVYEGVESQVVDFGLDPNTVYTYTAYAIDQEGNHSAGVSTSARVLPLGELDPSFNTVGYRVFHNAAGGNGFDDGLALVLDLADGIVVTGSSRGASSANKDLAVWRVLADGSLNSDFANAGIFSQDAGGGVSGTEWGLDLAWDTSGKLVVVGYGKNANDDMMLWRFSANGVLDTTFNGSGMKAFNNIGFDRGRSVVVDGNGKMIVAGTSGNGSNYDIALWRVKPDGSLDAGFGAGGLVLHDNAAGGNFDEGNARMGIALDGEGRILLASNSFNLAGDMDLVVWRFLSHGVLDASFANGGFLVLGNIAGGNGNEDAKAILVDQAGKIYVAGSSFNGVTEDMLLIRLLPDGALDTSFGSQGVFLYDNPNVSPPVGDRATALALDAGGNIVLAGFTGNGNDMDIAVWRVTPEGTLDTTFATGGLFTHRNAAGGGASDILREIVIDSLGRIVATGRSFNGADYDMVIMRIH